MKNKFLLILIFSLSFFLISFSAFALTPLEKCTSANGVFLPKCVTGCKTGCQVGYYLSDGDGDHTNNCTQVSNGRCIKSNVKGVCEICPAGFYCKGGMKDKIPCPIGKYTDKPGSIASSDCIAPPAGYCVAKAKLVGTGTVTVPSLCIETPTGDRTPYDAKDIVGAINSGMSNDEGISGYTLDNKLGANIAIPCPLGTYSTSGGAGCKVPDQGKCSSYDGINCVCGDTNGGGKPKPVGTDFTAAIIASGCLDVSHSLLGATKQVACPSGTYDLRTSLSSAYTTLPSPFCIYPDVGYHVSSTSTQTPCTAGSYDIREGRVDSSYPTCHLCTPGHYCPNEKMFTPTLCPAGNETNTLAATGASACTVCPAGTYDHDNASITVISSTTACKACLEGNYCTGGVSIAPCTAGTYRTTTGASSASDCVACPAANYCPSGSVNYITCPPGYYCPVGSSAGTPCLGNNQYCPSGSASPATCPASLYQDDAYASGCKGCTYSGWTNVSCQSNGVWYATRYAINGAGFSTCNSTDLYNNGGCTYCSNIAGNCGAGWEAGCYCKDWCGDGCGKMVFGCEKGCYTAYNICSAYNTCP